MEIAKLQQNIKEAEEALERMKKELEDAERMDSKDYYPSFNCDSVDHILRAIDDKQRAGDLNHAFTWIQTPQGLAYWRDRNSGRTPLSDEDKITLLRWCVNYYRAREKK